MQTHDREYWLNLFAVNAPKEIPSWFEPETPPPPREPQPPSWGNTDADETIRQWGRDDAGVDLVDFFAEGALTPSQVEMLNEYQDKRRQWIENYRLWVKARSVMHTVQWPWRYAEWVLAAREVIERDKENDNA